MKRILIVLIAIVATGVVLVVAVVAWIGWKGHAARERVEHLCAAFPAGADAASFAERANELGLRSLPAMSSGDRPPDVSVQTAFDGVMLARWSCTVEVAQGKVITSTVTFVD